VARLEVEVLVLISSSLSPVLRRLALARFLLWYSLSLALFCCNDSSWFFGAGGKTTVVGPELVCL
jgi:hypothetical protein